MVTRAKQRRLHKAFLRYHDPENWPLLREALKKMGRADLIGNGKKHLVPAWQPGGSTKQEQQAKKKISRKPVPRKGKKKQARRRTH